MYEAKKQAAEKTIEKKDAKLKEINNILAEEINPTLSKLKEERSAYLGTPARFNPQGDDRTPPCRLVQFFFQLS
jgi:hypothetical protein